MVDVGLAAGRPVKTAIVTGASRGIGRATAELLVEQDWRVLTLSRRPCPVEGVRHLSVDLLEPTADAEIGAFVQAELGDGLGVLALIHNAAMLTPDTADALDPTTMRTVLELNVVAPARLNRLLIPRMGPGSSVIYVGSTLAEKAVAGVASYVTSKHAVIGLMRSTCQDLKGRGIHTACVCPGLTRTEMLVDRAGGDPEVLDRLGRLSTFGRLIEPEEIATAIRFAADSPVINGAVLHANLGQIES